MFVILIEVRFTYKYAWKHANKELLLPFLLDFKEKNESEFRCEHSCHNLNSVLMQDKISLIQVEISF